MQVPTHIEASLGKEERALYARILEVCQRYPETSDDPKWVAGVVVYCLEIYLRICGTMKERGDWKAGFVEAHQRPPVLPARIMDAAARAMRRLTFEDANDVLVRAENTAIWTKEKKATGFSGRLLRQYLRRTPNKVVSADGSVEAVQTLVNYVSNTFFGDDVGRDPGPPISRALPSRWEPHLIRSKDIGQSSFSKTLDSGLLSCQSGMLCVTLGTGAEFVTDDPVSHPEATVFAEGNLQGGLFCPYGFGRGTWRLTIHLSLFNGSEDACVVYDFHARVYNRLTTVPGPASVGYSMAVELLVDNSILGKKEPVSLQSQEALNVALSLEASLFESRKTTIVFGLVVDYYQVAGDRHTIRSLPSDALYIFQHKEEWGHKCHFVKHRASEIEMQLKTSRAGSEAHEAFESLSAIMARHSASGGEKR